MFGTNVLTGKAAFKDAGDRLLITSCFLSLQGEGPYQGQPALFIRLTHCNLTCSFCDTYFDAGDWFSIQELTAKVLTLIRGRYTNLNKCGVVITGGEPSLQSNVAVFLKRCAAAGVAFTQIESNGILPIHDLPASTTLVVSPKCSGKAEKYLTPHGQTLGRADCLKFVISADPKSSYYQVPEWAFEWQQQTSGRIYISPMNIYRPEVLEAARQRIKERKEHSLDYRSTVDEVVSGWDDKVLDRGQNEENHRYAWKYAEQHGLFLTLQMQLFGAAA